MLRMLRYWSCIFCIALLFPLIITALIMTDGVIPLPMLSTEVSGEVVESWTEDIHDGTEYWCTVLFNDNGKSVLTRVRSAATIGEKINIRYHKLLLGYRATAVTNKEILYWLFVWYPIEGALLIPTFLLTLLVYMFQE